jgi:two-component system, NtrC family, nitrogen regulation sensor histidine kinase NtrY
VTFRLKLALIFTLTVVMAVTLVAWGVSSYTRGKFDELEQRHTDDLMEQFHRELKQSGDEIASRVEGIAESESTLTMAIQLSRGADPSLYVGDATGLAASHHLDFLDLATNDGTRISSKEWYERFGYKIDWLTSPGVDWNQQSAFLERMEVPNGFELGLIAVRVVPVGNQRFFVVGGRRLDDGFLSTLVLPPGTRAMFYGNLQPEFDSSALLATGRPAPQPERLRALIEKVCRQGSPAGQTIQWDANPASAESFEAIPRLGRQGQVLGVLLVGSSRGEQVTLANFIRTLGVLVGGAGIALGILLSLWVSARVSRPIAQLAAAAQQVAAGHWNTRVEVRSRDEVGQLAQNFNDMTRQLAEQRDKLVQTERVAAWRELARRLAHELKNPLFPLQLTIENLQRARQQRPEQFDEIFAESTATLRGEIENLKTVVARFSDFSKMPTPQLQAVNLNEVVRSAVRLYDAQFHTADRPAITPELYLDESLPAIQADPDLLHRALSNLILNSLDAMAAGGTLTVRTAERDGMARVEISDTGAGLTAEECQRLFTPYYTTKRQGSGLGLAVVQSIVSDHQGKISVESETGVGSTFRIDLPIRPASRNGSASMARETSARPEPSAAHAFRES